MKVDELNLKKESYWDISKEVKQIREILEDLRTLN